MYVIQKGVNLQFVFNYKLSKTGSSTQNLQNTENKAKFGHFSASKALDASHPQLHLQYLKKRGGGGGGGGGGGSYDGVSNS